MLHNSNFSTQSQSRLTGAVSFGFDLGHSGIKTCIASMATPTDRKTELIPTVVMEAVTLTDESTAREAANDTVSFRGTNYFVGHTAILQGNNTTYSGQDRDWVKTPTHDVMLIAAWKKSMRKLSFNPESIYLMLGLPSGFYAAQKGFLKQQAESVLGPFLLPGQKLHVFVMQQPLAPLYKRIYNADGSGNVAYSLRNDGWASIEIGHFSTDFGVINKGQVRVQAGESGGGMNKVYTAVTAAFQSKSYPVDLETLDAAILRRKIRVFNEIIDVSGIVDEAARPFVQLIIENAQPILDQLAPRLNGIVVAGGGAHYAFTAIKNRYPSAILEDDPRNAVAEGLCRMGLCAIRSQRLVVTEAISSQVA